MVQAEEKRKWSTVLPHTDRTDRGEIRRSFDPTANPELGVLGCQTLYEGLRCGAKINPMGPCLGYRAISTTGFATPYIYSSYTEVVARVDCVAAGFDKLQLLPPNDTGLKLAGLYLQNCPEWIIAEHAIFSVGGATVPFYDTCKFHPFCTTSPNTQLVPSGTRYSPIHSGTYAS